MRRSLGWTRALVALIALGLCGACDDECVDADGDGRGKGCARPDCDDDDASRGATCDPMCQETRNSEGCPCVGGRLECYPADPQTQDVGPCQAGRNHCADGLWGECEDAIVPVGERCNDIDDDCDGRVDEFVRSPCGGCDGACVGDLWGLGAAPFEPTDSLMVTRHGELMLQPGFFMASHVWVANGLDRTVSRIDAEAAIETARYRIDGGEPTRVAVDHLGDAWVLSPGVDGGQSMLARITADSMRCGDAQPPITSAGPDDLLPMGQDDCVLLMTPVGAPGELASSLSIDGQLSPDGITGGHPWVGFAGSERVAELDPDTGQELRSIDVASHAPHTSTFGPSGRLWIATRDGHLVGVDLSQQPPAVEAVEIALPCFSLEAIAAGPEGRLFMSGFACENIIAYDPVSAEVLEALTDSVLTTRGIALWEGDGFVAHTAGALSRFDREPLTIGPPFELASGTTVPVESIGTAADGLGHIWVVSNHGGPNAQGVATRFDTATEQVDAQVPVGHGPRALGDFTGNHLHGLSQTEGSATHVFRGCRYDNPGSETIDEPTEWLRAHLVWTRAPGASVQLEARHARTTDALTDAPFVSVGTLPEDEMPFALDFPHDGFLEVRLTLRTQHGGSSPRVHHLGVEWTCPGPE